MERIVIERMGPDDAGRILAAPALFDDPPDPAHTRRFLAEPTHHLLLATDAAGHALGFVSGVETTHPDKGTEMFLYELSVDEAVRRQGVGGALVDALAAFARERGCFGMWTGTEVDNAAARATYARAGAGDVEPHVFVEWGFAGGESASRC